MYLAVERPDLVGINTIWCDPGQEENLKIEKAFDISALCSEVGPNTPAGSAILGYYSSMRGKIVQIFQRYPEGEDLIDGISTDLSIDEVRQESPFARDVIGLYAGLLGINPGFFTEVILTHARDEG